MRKRRKISKFKSRKLFRKTSKTRKINRKRPGLKRGGTRL